MKDGIGRTIDYIRISVTDRCNLRCRYCMPEEGVCLLSHDDILTYEEILKIARAGLFLGINRVKITGGEPLIRRGVTGLIRTLLSLPGMKDVTMTTNGCFLKEHARGLKDGGLSSVNVSLDTLNAARFQEITGRDGFYDVLEGIEEAVSQGIRVKLNCAVMEELKVEEILAFAEFSRRRRIPVRFIEMMPMGLGKGFEAINNDRIIRILSAHYGDFEESIKRRGNGPAQYYVFDGGRGVIGFIGAVHHGFCQSCNRVRVTSDGFLKLCLDSPLGVDLKTPLREGLAHEELVELMADWIGRKPRRHHFNEDRETGGLTMNRIGG